MSKQSHQVKGFNIHPIYPPESFWIWDKKLGFNDCGWRSALGAIKSHRPIQLTTTDPWDDQKERWKSSYDLATIPTKFHYDKIRQKTARGEPVNYRFKNTGDCIAGVPVIRLKTYAIVFMRAGGKSFIADEYVNADDEGGYEENVCVQSNVWLLFNLFPELCPTELRKNIVPKFYKFCLHAKHDKPPTEKEFAKLF